MNEIIQKIAERWFLVEPALFAIYCVQQLEENTQMACLFRCGQGRVEYNPIWISYERCTEEKIEELFRVEMIRLLLKHPYERQPEGCLPEALTLGSNFVLDQHYRLRFADYPHANQFQLPYGQSFEWYAYKLDAILRQPDSCPKAMDEPFLTDQNDEENARSGEQESGENPSSQANKGSGGGGNVTDGTGGTRGTGGASGKQQPMSPREQWADQSELWEEDEVRQQEINEIIRDTTDWGTLPGDLVGTIKATLAVKLDYRKILSAFHTSILCSKRRLTRMKPSRRFGFAQMGSRYDLASRLLVAVDVSGSISSQTLGAFYSAIARFFKYGVETIDTVQFDVGLREVETFRKATREVKVRGRGGTDFQTIFDHIAENRTYDGLIILTDGYAPEPEIGEKHAAALRRTKVLWICPDEGDYNQHHEWMEKTGRACWMEFG